MLGLGVVDILASVEVVADGGGEGIGGIEILGHLGEMQHGLEHLGDLFRRGTAIARPVFRRFLPVKNYLSINQIDKM